MLAQERTRIASPWMECKVHGRWTPSPTPWPLFSPRCFVSLFNHWTIILELLFTPGCERSTARTQHNDLARVPIWDYSMPVSNDFKTASGFPKLQEQAHHLSSLSKLKITTEIVRSLTKDIKYWGPTDVIGQVAWHEHGNDNTQSCSWKKQ